MASALATLTISATLALGAGPATAAEPLFSGDDVAPNGEVSRRIWKPDFASAEAGGTRLSVGLALGLRGMVRDGLGRRATPALVMAFREGSSIALLPAGSQAMLVWSQPIR